LIDSVQTGLGVQLPCNYPCNTCLADQPSNCLSCQASSQSPYYFNGKCLDKCP